MYTSQPFLEIETTESMKQEETEATDNDIIKMRKPVLSIVSEPSNAIHVVQRRPAPSAPYQHNQRYVLANRNDSPSRNQSDSLPVCNPKTITSPAQYDIENNKYNSNDYYFPDTVDFGIWMSSRVMVWLSVH